MLNIIHGLGWRQTWHSSRMNLSAESPASLSLVADLILFLIGNIKEAYAFETTKQSNAFTISSTLRILHCLQSFKYYYGQEFLEIALNCFFLFFIINDQEALCKTIAREKQVSNV